MRKPFRQLNEIVNYCLEELFSFISPPTCFGCGGFLDNPHIPVCAECEEKAHFSGAGPLCLVCRSPIGVTCGCERVYQTAIPEFYYWGMYTDLVKELIHEFKFMGHKYLGAYLIERSLGFITERASKFDCDIIVPVPMTEKDKANRGFNQAELIAAKLAEVCSIPVENSLLRKIRMTELQAKLGRESRWENVRGAFGVADNRLAQGKSVLIVDDIVTTGATCLEAARVLRNAGAKRVTVFALFSSHQVIEEPVTE